MKDTTRAWLVATAILLGSAECSDSEAAPPPMPQPYVYQPLQQRSGGGFNEFLLWQNYIVLQQMQQEQMRANQQYEQYRRNALSHDRVRMLQEAFD